jgi:hypothetical protein
VIIGFNIIDQTSALRLVDSKEISPIGTWIFRFPNSLYTDMSIKSYIVAIPLEGFEQRPFIFVKGWTQYGALALY